MLDRKQATVLSLEGNFFDFHLSFLVVSGADRSILPSNLVPRELVLPPSIKLKGANDANIDCYRGIVTSVLFRTKALF